MISGLGIGWLIGLSLSPVLHIVVSSIVAAVVAVTAAIAGLTSQNGESDSSNREEGIRTHRRKVTVSPVPMALLVVGIAAGACCGIYARTHDWFGVDPSAIFHKWQGAGLNEQELKRRLFDNLYPPPKEASASLPKASADKESGTGVPRVDRGGLYAVTAQEAIDLRRKTGSELRNYLKTFRKNNRFSAFVDEIKDDQCLQSVAEGISYFAD
jgi:hypothetical protein